MHAGCFRGMGTARRIGKNALYLGTAEVISRILQFMVMLYAARLLSQQSFGKFSFAVSLSFIAVILADLGINTLIVREIARNKSLASKYFVNAFSIKILLSIIAFLVVAFVLNALLQQYEHLHALLLFQICLLNLNALR